MAKSLEVIVSEANGHTYIGGTGVNYGNWQIANINQYTGQVTNYQGHDLGRLDQRDYKTYLVK
jgi:hypothetical protein